MPAPSQIKLDKAQPEWIPPIWSNPAVITFFIATGTCKGQPSVMRTRYSPFRKISFLTRMAANMLAVAINAGKLGSSSGGLKAK
jgi:hypothetical protein